jgi:GT2 family glycosyltransferase
MGIAYYATLAKRHGLAFAETLLCVTTHGPVWWSEPGNEEHLREYYYLEVDHLERESVRLADVVISPSQHMLDWMAGESWQLPGHVHVQPHSWHDDPVPRARAGSGLKDALPIREIVFFGRLESRKGLDTFCDAIDVLCDRYAGLFSVTFLGKHHHLRGLRSEEFLDERMRRWNVPCRVLSEYYTDEAIAYLRGEGRIAVMPSYQDNSPLTVMECLLNAVPFLASDVGGIPEMIHPDDRSRVLFKPDALDMARVLHDVLEHGARLARLAFGLPENRARWLAWHAHAARAWIDSPATPMDETERPFISVCMAHHERPVLLWQALQSLSAQTYRDFEVILVDDASTSQEALSMLAGLAREFEARGWRLARQEVRGGPGPARNRAATLARGEYLLFMDDDNVAKPDELAIFARAAAKRRKEIYVCAADVFSGMDMPDDRTQPERRMLPLGSCAALGFFECRFGDTNSLMRRDWFLARGGFDERYDIAEDWVFLADTALAGIEIEVIPEALYWYRRTPNTRQDLGSRYRKDHSLMRRYQDHVPIPLRGLLAILLGKTRAIEEAWQWEARNRALSNVPETVDQESSQGQAPVAAPPQTPRPKFVWPAASPHLWRGTGRIVGDHMLCLARSHPAGHCLFGPGLRPDEHGSVQVGYALEGLSEEPGRKALVSLDIYDQSSRSILAIRHLTGDDLVKGAAQYQLATATWPGQRLEFRVYWHGHADILVNQIEALFL